METESRKRKRKVEMVVKKLVTLNFRLCSVLTVFDNFRFCVCYPVVIVYFSISIAGAKIKS